MGSDLWDVHDGVMSVQQLRRKIESVDGTKGWVGLPQRRIHFLPVWVVLEWREKEKV